MLRQLAAAIGQLHHELPVQQAVNLRGVVNHTPEWQAWIYDNSFAGGVFRRRGQFRGHLEDKMGLLDILNTLGGTSGDPRARPAPNQGTGQATSQGMSPMAKALLALLAIYA